MMQTAANEAGAMEEKTKGTGGLCVCVCTCVSLQVLVQRPLGYQGRIFELIRQIVYVRVAALHLG